MARGHERGAVAAVLVAALLALGPATAPAAAGGSDPICPRGQDACVQRLLTTMERNYERLGCHHDAAFALLYWRTTEGIRDALRAGRFSDRPLWKRVTTAFGEYYLDALRAWTRGAQRRAPKAWRIAFRAAQRKRTLTLGDVFLGINAHVNRDLAFVYYRLGVTDHDDHLQVNAVLARVAPTSLAEITAKLDPGLGGQAPSDPALQLDIFAWRELAWTNAQRLAAAPDARARRRIAAGIERHAVEMARRIRAAFPASRAATLSRDAFCRAQARQNAPSY